MKKLLLASLAAAAAFGAYAADGAVWHGRVAKEVANIDVVYSYELIANADMTLTANLTIDGFQQIPGAVAPQFKYSEAWPSMTATGDNSFTYTTSETFTEGQSFNELFFYMPYAGAADRTDIEGYTYGAANEAVAELPQLKASAENITTTSAEIVYSVTLPAALEGAEVEVLIDGVKAEASPIVLDGLTASTAYSYTLVARATLGGESVESDAVTVGFSTLRDGTAAAPVWTGRVEKEISSDVVTDPVHVVYIYELIANNDNTLTANLTIEGFQQVTGAVEPQFNYGFGFPSMTKTGDNSFTYTTSQTFEMGQSFNDLFFYMPFAGAADRTNIEGYTYGAADAEEPEDPKPSGIEAIEAGANAPAARYFDLRGSEVPASALVPGLYIRLAGSEATKVIIR